jgi:hypothetical protein
MHCSEEAHTGVGRVRTLDMDHVRVRGGGACQGRGAHMPLEGMHILMEAICAKTIFSLSTNLK